MWPVGAAVDAARARRRAPASPLHDVRYDPAGASLGAAPNAVGDARAREFCMLVDAALADADARQGELEAFAQESQDWIGAAVVRVRARADSTRRAHLSDSLALHPSKRSSCRPARARARTLVGRWATHRRWTTTRRRCTSA